MQDLPAPHDPGPRVVGRRRRDEEAQRGEREDRQRNAIAHGDARHSERRHSGTGCCQLVRGGHGAAKGRLWRKRCCPPLRRRNRSCTQLLARGVPLQDHDSTPCRARLAAGPDRSGGGCGRPAVVAARERVRPTSLRRSRRRHGLRRRHGPGVVGVAGRHGRRRTDRMEPGVAPARRDRVRRPAQRAVGHRRRRGLREDAGHRADRPRDRAGQRRAHAAVRRLRRHQRQLRLAEHGGRRPAPRPSRARRQCQRGRGDRLLPGPRDGQRSPCS